MERTTRLLLVAVVMAGIAGCSSRPSEADEPVVARTIYSRGDSSAIDPDGSVLARPQAGKISDDALRTTMVREDEKARVSSECQYKSVNAAAAPLAPRRLLVELNATQAWYSGCQVVVLLEFRNRGWVPILVGLKPWSDVGRCRWIEKLSGTMAIAESAGRLTSTFDLRGSQTFSDDGLVGFHVEATGSFSVDTMNATGRISDGVLRLIDGIELK